MTYLTFLSNGPHGALQPYRRDSYNPDQAQAFGASGVFAGKVVSRTNDDQSKTLKVNLDDSITVTTVDDKTRQNAQKMWSGLKNDSAIVFGTTLGGGLAALAGAVAIVALLSPLWPIALAVGVVGMGILGLSFYNLYRMQQAKEQLQQWNDPIPNFQAQRRLAGEKGYYHAYSAGYQGKIVSQKEFETLWYKEMDQWAEKYLQGPHLDFTQVADVRQFMETSPIGKGAFAAAFTADPKTEEAQFLKKLSTKFESLNTPYKDLRRETERFKSRVNNEKRLKLLENDTQRDVLLRPYSLLIGPKRLALELRRSDLQSRIRTIEIPQPRPSMGATVVDRSGRVVPGSRAPVYITPVAHIQRGDLARLDSELHNLDLIYAAMTAPIDALHRQNEISIHSWADRELQKIKGDEDKQLLHFHTPIKKLLEEYKGRKIVEEKETVEPAFDFGETSKAPELSKEFKPANYKHEWQSFVGEVDWENKILKTETIYRK